MRSPRPRGPRPWSRVDLPILLGVTVAAGLVRVVSLSRPPGFVFDEFYAADACWYLHASPSMCGVDGEISAVHPPLGKWLIALGIQLFGYSPGGWRIGSVVAGTLTVACVYVLARRLLQSTLAAVVVSVLLAFDFLHFVMSRTAMLDVFAALFGLICLLFVVLDRDRLLGDGPPVSGHRPLIRRQGWRIAAGVAGGAAAASKWSGWPFIAAAVLLTLWWEGSARRERGRDHPYLRAMRESGPSILLTLVALPILVYAMTFAGRLEGSLAAWPWTEGSWVRAFAERQGFMLRFHLPLEAGHPYSSPAWSWLPLRRPVLFFFADSPNGGYQEILAVGDPLLWWPAVGALGVVAVVWLRRRDPRAPEPVILAGFAAGYLPWLLLPMRGQGFLYYLLPATPFLYLALGRLAAVVEGSGRGTAIIAAFVAGSVLLFGLYYPLLTARPLSYPSWKARILFRDCGQEGAPRLRPVTEAGPPPEGWCWV